MDGSYFAVKVKNQGLFCSYCPVYYVANMIVYKHQGKTFLKKER